MKKSIKFTILSLVISMLVFVNTYGQTNTYEEKGFSIQYPSMEQQKAARYKLIKKDKVNLTIENRKSYIYAFCSTYDPADITVRAELQIYENNRWNKVDSWTSTGNSVTKVSVDESLFVTRTYEYRVKVDITVDNGTIVETDTIYSSVEECYNLF